MRDSSEIIVFLTLSYFALWITHLQVFTGKWTREPRPLPQSAHARRPACRVIGGIYGQSFENEGCMKRELKRLAAEREAAAEKEGLTFSSELHRLETSNDFVKFAAKRGADVKKKWYNLLESEQGQCVVGIFHKQPKVQETRSQACDHHCIQSHGHRFREEVIIHHTDGIIFHV